LGLGLQEFSMNPIAIPKVKKILRLARAEETRLMAEKLFQFSTASEIKRHVRKWIVEMFPEDFHQSIAEELKA
jgi:phosphotransferase system enzyme I (PtsI)